MTTSGNQDLANRQCIPCRSGVPPLAGETLCQLQAQLPDWKTVEGHHLEKTFSFPDFRTALEFVNRVGAEAEQQGHHPDLWLSWGKVEVRLFTHKINGLSEADFILAARIDRLT